MISPMTGFVPKAARKEDVSASYSKGTTMEGQIFISVVAMKKGNGIKGGLR